MELHNFLSRVWVNLIERPSGPLAFRFMLQPAALAVRDGVRDARQGTPPYLWSISWMRLATTLIGFGFTIVQFFDRLETMSSAKPALAPHLPRYLGLALIFSGVFGLLIAIWQYVWFVNYLHSAEFQRLAIKPNLPVNKSALAIAVALALIGAVAFVTVMFRLS